MPAISTKIVQWSATLKICFASRFDGLSPWYMLDMAYKSIIDVPYTMLPISAGVLDETPIQLISTNIPKTTPKAWEKEFKNSSVFVYDGRGLAISAAEVIYVTSEVR